jgi:superfamily II DNA or RNA helicase
MFRALLSPFRRVELRYIILEYELDLTESGLHAVKVFYCSKNKRLQVRKTNQLWNYNFSIEKIIRNRRVIWRLKEHDRQILLSLKSLNPELMEDGSLLFTVEPPVLNYLRKQNHVSESSSSKQVTISTTPLRPTVKAKFNPIVGLNLITGYQVENKDELINPERLPITRSGKYVRFGNLFQPLVDTDGVVDQLLQNRKTSVTVENTAEFLKNIKPEIDKTANWVVDPIHPVFFIDEPVRPVAHINFLPERGLVIETGFQEHGSDRLAHYDEYVSSKDGNYILVGDTFRPLQNTSPEIKELLAKPIINIPREDIPEFFMRDLVLIKKEFKAVLTDLASHIRVVRSSFKPVVRVSKDDQGWLDFEVSFDADDIHLPVKMFAGKNNQKFVQIDNFTWVVVDHAQVQKTQKEIEKFGAISTEQGYRVRVHEFASLEEFIKNIGGKSVLSQAYQKFIEQLTGFRADPDFKLPDSVENHLCNHDRQLRSYQREGVHWLDWLRKNYLHGILADDMGLGKTLQALCVVNLAYHQTENNQHSLIIAPKSVLYHWEHEVKRVFPFMRVHIYHGSYRNKKIFQSSSPYIVITTYDIVNRDIQGLSKVPFFYLILDEATKIKNPDARRTQSIKALNAMHRLALSGTPVENRPAELWSLFDFLMRGHLGRYDTFERIYEASILAGHDSAAQSLGRRIKPFLLRRKKEDVAKDLPEKVPIKESCVLTREQRQLYSKIVEGAKGVRASLQSGEYVNYATNILPILTWLKQVCDHPAIYTQEVHPIRGRSEKFDWVFDRIEEIVDYGEQVVVFSHFLGMLDLLETCVKQNKLSFIRIDGSTNNRQELIDRFNAGKAKVALLSLMAAGHGINLTAANHVIHADRWWNPAIEDQATDRVHRIGQNRTVFVYNILVQGTLEEKIERILESKRGMADQIMTAAADGSRQWSSQELLELLKPLE